MEITTALAKALIQQMTAVMVQVILVVALPGALYVPMHQKKSISLFSSSWPNIGATQGSIDPAATF